MTGEQKELSAERMAEIREENASLLSKATDRELRVGCRGQREKELIDSHDALTARIAELTKPVNDAEVERLRDLISVELDSTDPHHDDAHDILDRLARENAALESVRDLFKRVPLPPNAITWQHGVELLNELQLLAAAMRSALTES